ncbi:MAG: leucine-rich repeat domain-containing protein [Candidatus Eremiobacterota bacterium]
MRFLPLLLALLLALPVGGKDIPPYRRAVDLSDQGDRLEASLAGLCNYPGLDDLDLSFNDLTSLPELPCLKNLRALRLSANRLAEVPADLERATRLEVLTLRGNLLERVGPVLPRLVRLKRLDLADNRLTDVEGLGRLANLEDLELSDNMLQRLPSDFCRLRRLRRVNLSRNPFRSLPSGIGQLESLVELEMNGTLLTHLPPEIGRLRNLRRLALDDTRLTCLPREVGQLSELTELTLLGERIQIPDEIRNLGKLRELFVSQTLPPAEVDRLESLVPWARVHVVVP